MDLRFLKTFVGIAEAGSIGKACARLHVSQPAASRRIVALEAELGVQLFDRSGSRLKLTLEGEDLLLGSRRVLAEAESLGERARLLKSGGAGILRLGCTPQVIEAFVASFVEHYEERNPQVQLHVVEEASGVLPQYLERGEIDFAQMPAGDETFRWRLLYPTHALAIFASDHALAKRTLVEVKDLANEPLLLLSRESQARGWLDAAFNISHIRPKVAHESSVPHTLVALAAAGRGVALVPSNLAIPRRGVRAVPILLRGQPIGRWSSIAWHPRRFLPAYAERFIEEFVRFAQRSNPGRRYIGHAPSLPRPKEP